MHMRLAARLRPRRCVRMALPAHAFTRFWLRGPWRSACRAPVRPRPPRLDSLTVRACCASFDRMARLQRAAPRRSLSPPPTSALPRPAGQRGHCANRTSAKLSSRRRGVRFAVQSGWLGVARARLASDGHVEWTRRVAFAPVVNASVGQLGVRLRSPLLLSSSCAHASGPQGALNAMWKRLKGVFSGSSSKERAAKAAAPPPPLPGPSTHATPPGVPPAGQGQEPSSASAPRVGVPSPGCAGAPRTLRWSGSLVVGSWAGRAERACTGSQPRPQLRAARVAARLPLQGQNREWCSKPDDKQLFPGPPAHRPRSVWDKQRPACDVSAAPAAGCAARGHGLVFAGAGSWSRAEIAHHAVLQRFFGGWAAHPPGGRRLRRLAPGAAAAQRSDRLPAGSA